LFAGSCRHKDFNEQFDAILAEVLKGYGKTAKPKAPQEPLGANVHDGLSDEDE